MDIPQIYFSIEYTDPTPVLRSNNAYARENSHASPPSSPSNEEYIDVLGSDGLLESLDQFRKNILALRDANTFDPIAFECLVACRRSLDATNDYFALTNPQDDTPSPSDHVMEALRSKAEGDEGEREREEEEKEEEEEALTRTYHIKQMLLIRSRKSFQ